MADTSDLSVNTIDLHVSQLPDGWSQQLKEFFIKQPNFNQAVISAFTEQAKAFASLQQRMQRMEREIKKLKGV
jgi:type III secretory pathway lipoprotein EscJ